MFSAVTLDVHPHAIWGCWGFFWTSEHHFFEQTDIFRPTTVIFRFKCSNDKALKQETTCFTESGAPGESKTHLRSPLCTTYCVCCTHWCCFVPVQFSCFCYRDNTTWTKPWDKFIRTQKNIQTLLIHKVIHFVLPLCKGFFSTSTHPGLFFIQEYYLLAFICPTSLSLAIKQMLLQNYAIQPLEKVKLIMSIFPHSFRNNWAEQCTTRSYSPGEMDHTELGW